MTRFLEPEMFWLLALLPLIMIWRGRRGPVAAVEFSDVGLARQVSRRTKSRVGNVAWIVLPLLAGALMIAGLARPQRGQSRTEVTANGIDIVLGLDVSGSMQALDFLVDGQRVNRIEVVKSVVGRFIEQRPNDRIGLIAFAGSPYLVSPITLDHDWLAQNLERVNIGTGDDGTAIGSALAASINRLRTTQAKSKVVILLTDGMNNTGKISPLAAAEAAKALGVKVYTIGVGVRGKAPIPVRDELGNMHVVMAKVDVDEKTLQTIADLTGGKFYRATDTDSLEKIYSEINRLERTPATVQKFEHYDELYRSSGAGMTNANASRSPASSRRICRPTSPAPFPPRGAAPSADSSCSRSCSSASPSPGPWSVFAGNRSAAAAMKSSSPSIPRAA
jgi:Ca-activated chloride channel family protein